MKFSVLGLGESINDFKDYGDTETIGVNDIYCYHPAKYLVCVDPLRAFAPERLSVIINSTPVKFFSYLPEWNEFFEGRFELMQRNKPRSSLHKLDDHKDRVCYSICSPYVACVKAYQLGANEITMWGVDFTNHKTIRGEKLAIIERDFVNIYCELKKRNVKLMVGNDKSYLAKFIPTKPTK